MGSRVVCWRRDRLRLRLDGLGRSPDQGPSRGSVRLDIFRALANVKLQGMGIVQAGRREGKKAEGEQIGRLYVCVGGRSKETGEKPKKGNAGRDYMEGVPNKGGSIDDKEGKKTTFVRGDA